MVCNEEMNILVQGQTVFFLILWRYAVIYHPVNFFHRKGTANEKAQLGVIYIAVSTTCTMTELLWNKVFYRNKKNRKPIAILPLAGFISYW